MALGGSDAAEKPMVTLQDADSQEIEIPSPPAVEAAKTCPVFTQAWGSAAPKAQASPAKKKRSADALTVEALNNLVADVKPVKRSPSPSRGRSRSHSPGRASKREEPAAKGKPKAEAKNKSKRTRKEVAAGESMDCPICGVSCPKQKNTCYCPEHKRTTDALFRQAKKEKELQKKVTTLARQADKSVFYKLVLEFEASCPAPGNNLPRTQFDFLSFMQKERISLSSHHREIRNQEAMDGVFHQSREPGLHRGRGKGGMDEDV